MDPLTQIIGLLGIGFLLLYFISNLGKEHEAFKWIAIIFFVGALILVAKSLVDNNETCEIVLDATNITSTNYTEYYYTEYCAINEKATNSILFKLIAWFYRIFFVYMFIYVSYISLKFGKGVVKGK